MEESEQTCSHLEQLPVATRSALLDLLGKARDSSAVAGKKIVCCDCDKEVEEDQLMICLQCAPSVDARCGRYLEQHAYQHCESTGHPVCANLRTTSVWCYKCDSEVFLPDDDAGEFQEDLPERNASPEPVLITGSYPNPIAKFREMKGYLGDGSWNLSTKKGGGHPGLANLGNTCFLNSGLQAILHVSEVVDAFAQRRFLGEEFRNGNKNERLLSSFSELTTKIWSGNYEVCGPRDLIRDIWTVNPAFRGYDQQDTQEFLRCLLDSLHEALKHWVPIQIGNGATRTVERSLVHDLFQGLLLSQVMCENCHNVSEVYDPFMDLSLEIPSKQQVKKASEPAEFWQKLGGTSASTSFMSSFTNFFSSLSWSAPILTLDMCLQSFCSKESLIKVDQYSCEKCDQKVNASKVLSIGKCPEILMLHIKRFAHSSFFGSKLTTPIDFPLEGLDLFPYIRKAPPAEITKSGDKSVASNDSCLYDLCSIVKHMGSINGGHYVAYAKHHRTGIWYEFDDRRVSEVSEDTVRSQEAYILVYRKATSKVLSRPFDNFFEQTLFLKDGLPKVYISLYWLKKAELFSNPGPIDNWSLCCEHGVPLEGDLTNTKALQISQTAWKELHNKFGGGPLIPVDRLAEEKPVCEGCLDSRREFEKRRITYYIDEYPATRENYLISEHWLAQWRAFISGGPVPGPIDNAVLFETDGVTPKPGLECKIDYAPVNIQTWKALHRVYGGGPAIIRFTDDLYEKVANQHANISTPEEPTVTS